MSLPPEQSPEESVHIWDDWTYWFMTPFLLKVHQKGVVNESDVPDLKDSDKAEYNDKNFANLIKNNIKRYTPRSHLVEISQV